MTASATDPPDLRLVPAALSGWVGAWLGTAGAATTAQPDADPGGVVLLAQTLAVLATSSLVAIVVLRGSAARLRRHGVLVAAMAVLVGCGALLAGHGRVAALSAGPVVAAAAARSSLELVLEVTGDPVPQAAPPGSPTWRRDRVRVMASVRLLRPTADARSPPVATDTPVLVFAPDSWSGAAPGDVLAAAGRLRLPDRPGPAAAMLDVHAAPRQVARTPTILGWGEPPRAALRDAVAGFDPDSAGLLPSLVVGDETLLTDRTREELRATGLAHLTAVSGANVAIALGAVLIAARFGGVRGRALPALGVATIAGFVVLARPEPSVVRASAMGAVLVLGLVSGRRGRGIAPLALAVSILVLVDPWLARSLGFALSCAATAGIVLLARPWAHAAYGWMPRPLAAALAVPLAAQLACTPLLVGMTGALSLSALPANVLAAPAVAPATVLGLAVAVIGTVAPGLAHVVAAAAMLPTTWIVLVAQRCADLPGTVLAWSWGVPLATAATLVLLLVVPTILRSPLASVAVCAALVTLLVRPVTGWPPDGWVLVACDVGQGDAVVLRAGPGQAVVVDTGPDPDALDRCLTDLGVTRVPLLVVSHFDADHSAGIAGLGPGRGVREVLVTVVDEPHEQAQDVADWAARHGAAVVRAVPGDSGRVGDLRWTVLWPRRVLRGLGSVTNQASVVLRVEVAGLSVLLTGDIEPPAQRALMGDPALDVDILKVPHHGSGDQEAAFLSETSAAVAVISVGADNPYGQPSDDTIEQLQRAGSVVARTDTDGDVAVVRPPDADRDGPAQAVAEGLVVVRRGRPGRPRGMLAP